MSQVTAISQNTIGTVADLVRRAIVLWSALALIFAGDFLPL